MKTYPEQRFYSWEATPTLPIRSGSARIASWHGIARNCHGSSKNPVAAATWAEVLTALDDIECDYHLHELSGKRFKQLLVGAAKMHEWFAQPSPRRSFTAMVEGHPELRRCARCNGEKPLASFRAVMSEKRKAAYLRRETREEVNDLGVTVVHDSKRDYYIHHLCAECRTANARRKRDAAKVKADNRKMDAKTTERVESLRTQLKIAHIVSRRHKNGKNALGAFHSMRSMYIYKARSVLNKRILANIKNADAKKAQLPYPDEWQDLLTPEDRQELLHAFNTYTLPAWSGKGRTPSCF